LADDEHLGSSIEGRKGRTLSYAAAARDEGRRADVARKSVHERKKTNKSSTPRGGNTTTTPMLEKKRKDSLAGALSTEDRNVDFPGDHELLALKGEGEGLKTA